VTTAHDPLTKPVQNSQAERVHNVEVLIIIPQKEALVIIHYSQQLLIPK
jgi:hypothetical protein